MKFFVSFLFFTTLLFSCSPFVKVSTKTNFGREDGYTTVYNSEVNFKSLTFGDFKFAKSYKEFKKLNQEKLKIKDILFYAKTYDPPYEYYVLLNPKNKNFNTSEYKVKDTLINNNNFIILISKSAPKPDSDFITENIFENNF